MDEGDAYDVLNGLLEQPGEKGKYRLIVTSPPYYGHRHYGKDSREIGQEKTDVEYIDHLAKIFAVCRYFLTEDGSLWIVIGDTRRRYGKLMIPHRLAERLVDIGYTFREDIIWYKKIMFRAVQKRISHKLMKRYYFYPRMKNALPT